MNKYVGFIEKQAQVLSSTSIADSLRETLKDTAKKKKLGEFFTSDQIEYVAGLMLKNFKYKEI